MYLPPTSPDPIITSPPLHRRGLDSAIVPYKGRISPPSSPSKYGSLLKIIKEEKELVATLPAVEFCVSNEDEAVQSSDYFFDGLSPLIGKEKNTFRPRKFKDLTKEAKEEPPVKALREERKKLQQELDEWTIKRMPLSFTDMIVCLAKRGQHFLMVEHYLPPTHTALPLLKSAYQKAVDACQPLVLPARLDQLVDLGAMDHSLALTKAGYNEPKYEGKINKAAWDDRTDLVEVFNQCWNEKKLRFTLGKDSCEDLTLRKYFKHMLSQAVPLKTGGVYATLKNQCRPGSGDIKILNSIIAIIITEIEDLKKKRQDIAEAALISLREECLKDPLNLLIEEASTQLIIKESIRRPSSLAHAGGGSKIVILSNIMKEQRQHSLARFYNLVNYYTAFVNTIHLMGEAAEKIKPGSKTVVADVVSQILDYSFLELDENPRARNALASLTAAPTTALSTEEIKKLITIFPQVHRERDIMGWEKEPLKDHDKEIASQTLNLFLALFNDQDEVKKFERAHTLPFPSCFTWKEEKEREFITNTGESFTKAPKSKQVLFNHSVFKKIATEKVDHKEIEDHFRKEFESYTAQYDEASEFIYMSLETVRRFYLRLFSETELLPDFINIDLDGISEWREPDSDLTYKKSLASALKSLVQTKSACTHADVINALVPYFAATQKKVALLHRSWSVEKDKSSKMLIKLIGLYQVEESLRTALLSRSQPGAISAIFAEAIPVSS